MNDNLCTCNDPNCASASIENAMGYIASIPLRVVKREDGAYINLEDMGRVAEALLHLQMVKTKSDIESGLDGAQENGEYILHAQYAALGNLGIALHDERSYVDPEGVPDTVPEDWKPAASEWLSQQEPEEGK